jgi:hypothetical protein
MFTLWSLEDEIYNFQVLEGYTYNFAEKINRPTRSTPDTVIMTFIHPFGNAKSLGVTFLSGKFNALSMDSLIGLQTHFIEDSKFLSQLVINKNRITYLVMRIIENITKYIFFVNETKYHFL